MDYRKFPHIKDNDPSQAFTGTGRGDARFLGTIDAPYLKMRRPGTGVLAEKKGDFLYMSRERRAGPDGFYAMGQVGTDLRVVGSSTARGTFARLGNSPGQFIQSGALGFYGRGLAIVPGQREFVGSFNDFDGRSYDAYNLPLYLSRDGIQFDEHYTVTHFQRPDLFNEMGSVGAGAYTADPLRFTSFSSFMTMTDDGQHVPLLVVDRGDSQVVGGMLYQENQLYASPLIIRLGPRKLLAMNRNLRPNYAGSIIDAGSALGVFFTMSEDSGLTWSLVASPGSMWNDFQTVRDNVPHGGPGGGNDTIYGNVFNLCTINADVLVVPISASRSVLMAAVPRITSDGLGGLLEEWRTYLGWLDHATGQMTAEHVLYDGPSATDAAAFFNAGAVLMEDGVRYFTRPTSPTNDEWNEPRQILHTVDGTSYTLGATMPLANYLTGQVTSVSPNKLICPMYDGNHSLYESLDEGVTWTKRATLYVGAPAPDPLDRDLFLSRFNTVSFLRFNGRPQSVRPSAPWLDDERVEAPV